MDYLRIDIPEDNSTVNAGKVKIYFECWFPNGFNKIDFYVDGALTETYDPFRGKFPIVWNVHKSGDYVLTLDAKDNSGTVLLTSSPVHVTVKGN